EGDAVRDVLELPRERVVEPDRGRARRRALLVALDDLHRVEVEAAVLLLLRTREVARGRAQDGDPRRQRERLLHPGESEVDPVPVEVDRRARDVADEVDEE